MKNKALIQTLLLFCITAIQTTLVYAHPGHDHNSWSSFAIHLLQFSTAIIAMVAIAFFLKQSTKKQARSINHGDN